MLFYYLSVCSSSSNDLPPSFLSLSRHIALQSGQLATGCICLSLHLSFFTYCPSVSPRSGGSPLPLFPSSLAPSPMYTPFLSRYFFIHSSFVFSISSLPLQSVLSTPTSLLSCMLHFLPPLLNLFLLPFSFPPSLLSFSSICLYLSPSIYCSLSVYCQCRFSSVLGELVFISVRWSSETLTGLVIIASPSLSLLQYVAVVPHLTFFFNTFTPFL